MKKWNVYIEWFNIDNNMCITFNEKIARKNVNKKLKKKKQKQMKKNV